MNSRLALGTAQFGMNYGISNHRGKIPEREVQDILELAVQNGITTLDTAFCYGDSEAVLGRVLKQIRTRFKIISKVSAKNSVDSTLDKTLERLCMSSLYGYLLHDFSSVRSGDLGLYSSMQDAKADGRIKKAGFSLYYPDDLDYALEQCIEFDIVQVPYSIFDQRFQSYFPQLHAMGIEIHIRSVFLQGLFFCPLEDIENRFPPAYDAAKRLHDLAEQQGLDIACLCLNYAMMNESVDRIVIGVERIDNLYDNLKFSSEMDKVQSIYNDLLELRVDNNEVLLPFLWR